MKKIMMIAAGFALAAVMQVQAMSLAWSTALIDNIGTGNPVVGYVELVWGSTVISSAMDLADGAGASASMTFRQDAIGTGTYNIPGGQSLFFRVYNATTVGAATKLITTDSFVMPTYANPTDTTAGGLLQTRWSTALDGQNGYIDVANDSRWTPVPEPTSFALLALGAAAVGLRRRIRVAVSRDADS